MSLATSLKAITNSQFTAFGSSATIKSVTQNSRVPGGEITSTVTSTSVKYIPVTTTIGERQIGAIRPDERKVLVAAQAVSAIPSVGDRFTNSEGTFDIKSVTVTSLQDTNILYELVISGAE